jgi:hypothetical protein
MSYSPQYAYDAQYVYVFLRPKGVFLCQSKVAINDKFLGDMDNKTVAIT